MVPEPIHAHVLPLVAQVGVETEFSIAPAGPEDRLPQGEYLCELRHIAHSGTPALVRAEWADDGRVRFRCVVEHAGEVTLTLLFPGGRRHGLGSVYGLDADLADLLPLRGDFHTHTWHSDGRSSPRELLEAAWGLGLDFVAVTDHDNWAGSREAVEAGRSLPITVIPGEEVSFDRGHVVAVGIGSGVRERQLAGDHETEVAAIAAGLRDRGDGAEFAPAYARAIWATRAIRDLGGLAILAHPFWVAGGELHLDEGIARRLYQDREIDAVELLGDVEFDENLRSIALHTEMAGEGARMPVVANSDTHGLDHTLGCYWTVVFAAASKPKAILEAVRQGLSVACVQLPGEQLRIYGPLRLVHYAYFLHRRYFPQQTLLHGTVAAEPVDEHRRACLCR